MEVEGLPSDQAIHDFPTATFRVDRSLDLGRAFASVAAHALGDHGLYVFILMMLVSRDRN